MRKHTHKTQQDGARAIVGMSSQLGVGVGVSGVAGVVDEGDLLRAGAVDIVVKRPLPSTRPATPHAHPRTRCGLSVPLFIGHFLIFGQFLIWIFLYGSGRLQGRYRFS